MVCRLKDIANALNISVNTVSRALKDMPDISVGLKKTVRAKALEMGYIPNQSARILRTGKTSIIAIIYDHYINPYYSIVTDILHRKFSENGYNLIIFTESVEKVLKENRVREILSRGVDGIVSFLEVDEDAKNLVEAYNVNLLVVGRDCSKLGVDCIAMDDERGGYIAGKHLIDNGHRDIVVLGGPNDISCFIARLNGFKRAFSENNLPIKPEYIINMGADGMDAHTLFETVKKRKLAFSAVFCFNDLMAYESINLLNEAGLRVPEDISIVGYDFIESHLHLPVKLSTVDTDKEQLADIASEVMLLKIEQQGLRSFKKVHTPTLVAGKTVIPFAQKVYTL